MERSEWVGLSCSSLSWGSLGHCGWKGGWKGRETHVDLPLSPTISCLRHCCFLRAKHLRGEPPRKGPQDFPPGFVVLQTTWPKM